MARGTEILAVCTQRIKNSPDKEKEILKILDELGSAYSWSISEKIQFIGFWEQYVRNLDEWHRPQPCREVFVPCRTGHSSGEVFHATDNSKILDALDKVKSVL